MMLSDTSTEHMPCLAGCDPAAQQLFRARYPPVLAFLQTHLAVTDEWGDILAPEVRTTLHTRFLALEQRVIQSRLGHRERDTAAHWHYRRTYLIPLAQALDFFDAGEARHTAMTQALQHIQHDPNQLLRPALDVCDARFTNERQARVFVDAHICVDMPTARTLARTLTQNAAEAERRAANRARSLVLAAIAYGWVGLLENSDYPHTAPLVLLQAQADLITRLSDDPLATLATLRADLIALHYVLQPLHVVWKEKRQPYRKQKLWVESLLHRPPDDPLREQYRQRLTEEMRQTVVQNLAWARGCYTGDASDLFEMFHHDGLPILIDWRCQIAALTSQRVLVQQRLAQAVVQHLAALHQRHRQEIIRLVEALAAACQETGVHLPLPRLLSDYPSSRYRRSLGRRLPFGFGAMAQRRMRRRKRRRVWLGRRRPRRQQTDHTAEEATPQDSPEDRLVAAFTRHAGLSPADAYQEARTRVRQFITFGGIGLLPKAQWDELLDARVTRALAFYTFGYLPGTIGWVDVLRKTQAYAASLGLVPPSSQLAKVVFHTIGKPVRWHGGDGPAVRQVRQRQTLMLDAPRLHETWLVVPVTKRLRLPLIDAAGHQVSDTCRALLVFDTAIERPVGYWLSTTAPTSREVGLVLYQAIWHPGALTWPLRGVPDCIQVPEMLVSDGIDDLKRAAAWMHSAIESITRRQMDYALSIKLPYAAKLLDTLAEHAPDYIRWKTGREAVTIQEAMDALRTWLHVDKITRTDLREQDYPKADCFPNHNAPDVPASIAQYGVALPGHHLPAAGWLLPVAEHTATTVRDAVEYRNMTYTDAGFRSEPGRELAVRLFPYWYQDMEQGIFVETAAEELRYLVRQA